MRRIALIAVCAALSALATPAAPASSPASGSVVRRCHHFADFNILISSARNMSCRAAQRDMRRYRGSIRRRFRTPAGFLCTRVSGGPLGGQWRCVKGPKAYRFEFGD